MKVVGITGGIASGKSTLSAYLKDRYKAYIFNADKEAKKLLNDDIVKDKIKAVSYTHLTLPTNREV